MHDQTRQRLPLSHRRQAGGLPARRWWSAGSGAGRVWRLNVVLVGAALAVVGAASHAPPGPDLGLRVAWPLLAATFCFTEVFVLHLHFRREAHTFSLAEVPLVVGLWFVAPAELVAAQLVGAGAALVLHRRQSPLKLVFNLATFALQTSLAVLVFRFVLDGGGSPGGPLGWLATFAAVAVATVVSAGLIVCAISLSDGQFDPRKLVEVLATASVVAATNTCLALMGANVLAASPGSAWLLLVPGATLYGAYRAYLAERENHLALEFLFDSTRVLHQAADLEGAVVELLDHTRRTFRADVAEITLFPGTEGEPAFRTTSGPGASAEVMVPVEADPMGDVWERMAEGREALVLDAAAVAPLARRGVRAAMGTALRGEARVLGVLLVANRLSDVGTFGGGDLRLLQTLAEQVSAVLEKGRLEQSLAQLRELEARLTHQAFHDSLTGLANRALFADRLQHALARRSRSDALLAVMFVDLDDFKTINDSLGHAAGDALLAAVADRLRAGLRPGDTAARLGGDEFAVLVEDIADPDEAVVVAERVIGALRQPVALQGTEVLVHASVGIAVSASADDDVDELMSNADLAMYAAKGAGKGRYEVFEPRLRQLVLQRHEINAALQRAIERDEFVLDYQPITAVADGRLVGVEALLRWQHPERGTVPPTAFVPVAEETGQIVPIGRWILQEACRQAQEWQRRFPHQRPLVVSVNLSARQLGRPELLEEVVHALHGSGLPAASLLLEITESVVMEDADQSKVTLSALKRLGVRVAIDDFGTGYSSLSYLRTFPVDVLKIAKDFVDDLGGSEPDAFVDAMVKLGHTLGLEIIAEGVETAGALAVLHALGAEMAQGFHLAPPLTAAGVATLLEAAAPGPARLAAPAPPGEATPGGPSGAVASGGVGGGGGGVAVGVA